MAEEAGSHASHSAAGGAGEPAPPAALHEGPAWYDSTFILVVICLLHLLLGLILFVPTPHMGGDSGTYVSLARALAEGRGYVEIYDPAAQPHTHFPPVFPAILAVALRAGLEPWIHLKLLVLGFSVVAVAATHAWVRTRAAAPVAMAVTALVALSGGIAMQARWVLSDVPFWALTMLALWLLERASPERARGLLLAAAAVTLAYFTRSAGLPLVVAAAAWLAYRRRWRDVALLLLVFLPFALLWRVRAHQLGGDPYLSAFLALDPYAPALGQAGLLEILARLPHNFWQYLTRHVPILLFGHDGMMERLLAGLALGLGAAGWVRRVRRPGAAEFFLPLYIGLLLLWPRMWSGERLILPVISIVLLYAAEFLLFLLRGRRRSHAIALGAGALLLAAGAVATVSQARDTAGCMRLYAEGDAAACMGAHEREFIDISQWARSHLPADAVVLSRKPSLFYVLSDRRGRAYPLSGDPAQFFETADEAGARFVVADGLDAISGAYLQPVLLRRENAFCLLRMSGGSMVLGIQLPPPPALPDPPDEDLDLVMCGGE